MNSIINCISYLPKQCGTNLWSTFGIGAVVFTGMALAQLIHKCASDAKFVRMAETAGTNPVDLKVQCLSGYMDQHTLKSLVKTIGYLVCLTILFTAWNCYTTCLDYPRSLEFKTIENLNHLFNQASEGS